MSKETTGRQSASGSNKPVRSMLGAGTFVILVWSIFLMICGMLTALSVKAFMFGWDIIFVNLFGK